MTLELNIQRQILLILFVAVLFMFYMELVFIPRFYLVTLGDYGLMSFPLGLRNDSANRFINAGGVLLFALSLFGGRSLIHLLESLKEESDRFGCISAKGRYKEHEPC